MSTVECHKCPTWLDADEAIWIGDKTYCEECEVGMFDWINYECDCPVCGKKVDGFQSKDGDCQLETIEPATVNHFYTDCTGCDSWMDFKRDQPGPFTRTVETPMTWPVNDRYTKIVDIEAPKDKDNE